MGWSLRTHLSPSVSLQRRVRVTSLHILGLYIRALSRRCRGRRDILILGVHSLRRQIWTRRKRNLRNQIRTRRIGPLRLRRIRIPLSLEKILLRMHVHWLGALQHPGSAVEGRWLSLCEDGSSLRCKRRRR